MATELVLLCVLLGVAAVAVAVVAVVLCLRARRGQTYGVLGGRGGCGYTPPSFTAAPGGRPSSVDKDDFALLQMLGKGAFAKVYLVRLEATGEVFAMKVLSKKDIVERDEVEHTLGERNILLKVDHPFIVRMYYAFQSPSKLFFVLEYVPGGELFTLLQRKRRLPEEQVRLYAAEMVLALEHLHSLGIIYRDLKPENVLLDKDGHIRLADFGLSKEETDPTGRTGTLCGTPEYLAPEVLRGRKYNRAVDWWSFGTLVYEMFLGLPPFYEAVDKTRMFKRIMRGKLVIPDKLRSRPARDLIAKLLVVEPEERLGSGPTDAAPIRAHPFFADLDFGAVYNKAYTPVHVPRLATELDVSHFDQHDPQTSAYTPSAGGPSLLATVDQDVFAGFTYTDASHLGGGDDGAGGGAMEAAVSSASASASRSGSRSS
ncbi:AGC protein kinase [Thecamonas trahens ATCC 50062]|uniref:non-specific serine/threonine protein kinase n=1 Tax=Thecamonas trahens ATCC 50062 TaxID=461836 RepID=A0A0L0DEI8_THETB|nr:AGC protein kinase [Thecamonas trahens ATCC 50062]KNC49743.1 AGC protein kinase [Thecamonas trahens ATCC 50062]|eukprot:XP_013757530.1 AGC protein kinase [Thecamonas trahens ATCC 50062]